MFFVAFCTVRIARSPTAAMTSTRELDFGRSLSVPHYPAVSTYVRSKAPFKLIALGTTIMPIGQR